MAMSSYMVNSKYVDPKFPPCEEYSQNNYIPEQGSDYYSPSQDTDFQHPGIYPRSNYSEQPFSCNAVQDSTVQPPRGHVHDKPGHPSPFSAQTEPGGPLQAAGARTCGQQPNTKSQNGTQAKQPAVVYPWMKKVHVTTGKASPASIPDKKTPDFTQSDIYESPRKASAMAPVISVTAQERGRIKAAENADRGASCCWEWSKRAPILPLFSSLASMCELKV